MKHYAWHEDKRRTNLEEHGLDFLDFEVLTVLTVAYIPNEVQRIISFRPANKKEIEVYYEWLSDTNDA
jgi:uncharacterized DUF497 family protein